MYTLIKNGYVYDNSSRSFSLGDILIKDGKIASVSALGESCPTDAKVIDAKGKGLPRGLLMFIPTGSRDMIFSPLTQARSALCQELIFRAGLLQSCPLLPRRLFPICLKRQSV